MNAIFDQIEWPEKPLLADLTHWEQNREIIRMLTAAGRVTEWLRVEDGYHNMPYHYNIGGADVAFLPHWGGYQVNGKWIHVDKRHTLTEEELRNVIRALAG